MDAASPIVVAAASAADPGTVQGVAAISVLKKAINLRTSPAAQLVDALPRPSQLATSGTVGTQFDAFA